MAKDNKQYQEVSTVTYWMGVADEYEDLVQKQKMEIQKQEREIQAADSVMEKMALLLMEVCGPLELARHGFTIMRCAECECAVWASFDEYGFMPDEHEDWCSNY